MSDGLHLLQLITAPRLDAGAEYAIRLAAGLAGRGHRVIVGGRRGSAPLESARAAGLPVVEAFDFRLTPLAMPRTLRRLRDYLRQSRFDLVNVHRREDHLFAALALGPHRPVPLVRTHTEVPRPGSRGPERLLNCRGADAHVLVARFMRLGCGAVLRRDPGRVAVIPPGMDGDDFRRGAPDRQAARQALGLPRAARVAGFVARFSAERGVLDALEAFARVRRLYPDVRFVMAGGAGEILPEALRERAAALGLGNALHVIPDPPDARGVTAALDVGVVASTGSETICRAALEFLALGVPVVGTDLHAIPEIVPHGVAGLIVPPGNPEALATAIGRLLDDPALRERLGEAGPEHLRRAYARERFLDTTEGFYRALIRRHR
jgi:glycosyltransferase involved in cell wall biosynthesis